MSCTGALAPGNDSRPRVAVCIVGFARTFAERGVYTTIEHAFRPVGSRVDFYGVVSLGGGTEHDTAKGQWKAVPALALRPALELLRPVAWEDNMPMRQGPPPCNLACMRQYERLEQCGTLVRRVETLCNLSYTTVVKTRPDIAFFGQNQPHVRNDTVYKDTAAGDMVVYIPRWSFDELTRLLSSNLVGTGPDCSSLHRSIQCNANGTGPACKCNAMLSFAAAKVGLRMKYHRNTPHVVRTREAIQLMQSVPKGVDIMKALHNKGQHDRDVTKWLAAHNGSDSRKQH
mmetsp:Transcript_30220/g.73529  ORF Transcript_30220/g.73529 Transcript_30220/m.73529 type:complete len:286 (+) Transcript_30220:97-954(+)